MVFLCQLTCQSAGGMASLCGFCVCVSNISKITRPRDMLLLLKDTSSIEDDKVFKAYRCVCLFSIAVRREVPPPIVWKFNHFFILYICIRPQVDSLVYQVWIFLNYFFMNFFEIIFLALRFMKSYSKSLITWKVLHLEHFVKICYSATFSIPTMWWVNGESFCNS